METSKPRIYWMKVKENFLTSNKVDYLIDQDNSNGFVYVVLYQALCLNSIQTKGRISVNENEALISSNLETLVKELKWFTKSQIEKGLILFSKLGLIYEDDEGGFRLTKFDDRIESISQEGLRKRVQRSKVGQCPKKEKEPKRKILNKSNAKHCVIKALRSNALLDSSISNNFFTNKEAISRNLSLKGINDLLIKGNISLQGLLIESGLFTKKELEEVDLILPLESYIRKYGYLDTKIHLLYVIDWIKSSKTFLDNPVRNTKDLARYIVKAMAQGFKSTEAMKRLENELTKYL